MTSLSRMYRNLTNDLRLLREGPKREGPVPSTKRRPDREGIQGTPAQTQLNERKHVHGTKRGLIQGKLQTTAGNAMKVGDELVSAVSRLKLARMLS